MMVIRDGVTDAEEIAATLIRFGLCSTPPPLGRSLKSSGEVQYVVLPTNFLFWHTMRH
jgi:hypothetical protein